MAENANEALLYATQNSCLQGAKAALKAGATPIRQPEPYWRSRADAAAKILNPMYASNAGTTPMQQPQSLRSRADAAANMINPIYASGSADSPMDQPQSDNQARANDDENTTEVTYATIPDDPPMDQPQARANDDENTPDATIPDGAYPGGVSGRRDVCSFLRARRSCLAAGIAVLLSLCAVGVAPLTFSIKQEISQLSTTMKRDMHQLATTVNALKCDQGDMCKLFDTVDALKLDLDNERNRSATLEQRLKDDMSTAVDALKLDLDNERNRSATLEQRLLKMEKSLPSCPEGYTKWRGICYKAFNTRKNFTEAAAACRADGGTLAMPRDAETDAFLISLYKSVRDDRAFWFGLHYQQKERRFEWVDGSALGPYSSWAPGEPHTVPGGEDCVSYTTSQKWNDHKCHDTFPFICQNTQAVCPKGHTKCRGICYKAFNTRKNFTEAAAACRADGGTLAMPRDAETNAFLISLYKSVRDDRAFWFGLHDQAVEGRFEWVDGSSLGPYSSWAPGEPNNLGCCDDCVVYSARKKDKWGDEECHKTFRFICQAAPERP
ncbi:PREDICTED: asialoglycoprotein receptor 2-like [Branchiostoma belcheri]|uniref:Asialoglycoprotein receptor 2-like n=1 Tax=Branchiostoma belcheri TaxID=7741 RepID=A0A6P4ZEY4_BRABE|nr:PREDICTED: asialoglycoprotein receptor 2-like [Branchiostoma belcheri]